MSHKDSNVTFTIVAFRYDQKRSVLYKGGLTAGGIVHYVQVALDELKADVISIRRVYTKNPLET